jgi:hypothetical protein
LYTKYDQLSHLHCRLRLIGIRKGRNKGNAEGRKEEGREEEKKERRKERKKERKKGRYKVYRNVREIRVRTFMTP